MHSCRLQTGPCQILKPPCAKPDVSDGAKDAPFPSFRVSASNNMSALTDPTYAEILAEVRRLRETVRGPIYRISILSNVLVNSLLPVMEWLLLREGVAAEIRSTTFDNIVQDSASLGQVDAAIVFMDMAGFASTLAN